MIGIGVFTKYRVGSSLSIVLVIFGLVLPVAASAQLRCDQLRQRIYQITSTEAAQAPDSLHTVLALTDRVRECKAEMPPEWEAWLLNNEVFALDRLQQYDRVFEEVSRTTPR